MTQNAVAAVAFGLIVTVWCIAGESQARTAGDPAMVCDQAAQAAAQGSGVPVSVLRAISRTETGRSRNGRLQPWPWTVNMEGTGAWFDNESEARQYVERHFKRGARSFDVGCFQLNYKWHGQAFSSIEEMFEPGANARYAAQFLKSLYAELGDWSKAAGAYHSRTPKFATRYRKRFDRIWKGVADLPDPPPAPPEKELPERKPARPGQLIVSAGRPLFDHPSAPTESGLGSLFSTTPSDG